VAGYPTLVGGLDCRLNYSPLKYRRYHHRQLVRLSWYWSVMNFDRTPGVYHRWRTPVVDHWKKL